MTTEPFQPKTSHDSKVAGWSILGLFLSGLTSMVLAAFAPHLTPSAQTTLLNIGLACVSAVAGSLVTHQPSSSSGPPTG